MRHRFRTPTMLASMMATMAFAFASTTAIAQNSIRTGDGLMSISASMPDSARAGEQFSYEVRVRNASDNVVLHDVELTHSKAKGFTVESVSLQGDSNKKNKNKQNKNDQSEKSSSDSSSKAGKSKSSSNSHSADKMTIAMLEPGQSETFKVKATADEPGDLRACIEIVNYTPAICLKSEIVKPELELTKSAPKKANRCEMVEIQYAVKNGGSGDVGAFQITDDLGKGLATIEGNSKLSFDVDGLDAGETRKFVARVYAREPGEFSSRAVAKAKNSDLKSRSKETTTEVVTADLAATLDGPNKLYGEGLAQFQATVTNNGNAPAEDVLVTVHWPDRANLADMGNVSKKKADSEQSKQAKNNKDNQKEPTVAKKQSDNQSKKGSSKNRSASKSKSKSKQQMEMAKEQFTIDRLAPGQTASFDYAVRVSDIDRLPTKVVAKYTCTVDAADDTAKARAEATTTAMATVEIVRLPALQLVVIDDEDPVADGNEVTYTIRVWNEGDASDQNVKLSADLPEGLEFVSAEGPTELKQKGSDIQFAPIDKMEPGDRVDYKVVAKSSGTGNVRFEAELESEMLNRKVVGEEPTRLFNRQAQK